jgi:beta-lactamase regulating signal transducer with metallopeptidase domain
MLIDIYYSLLLMSAVATGLYLLLRILRPLTLKAFSSFWHYYTGIFLYLLFLLPFYKLVSMAGSSIGQTSANGSEIVSVIDLGQTAVSNPVVNAISAIPQTIYSATPYWDFLPYIFIAGTVIFIAVVSMHSFRLNRSIFKTCRLNTDTKTLEIFSKCKKEMGISGNIPVYTSSYTGTPFLSGIFKPRLVLPDVKFTPEDLRCVFLHELTHYKRHDTGLKCLMLIINSIHWFNPFAYIARRDIDRMCEMACDESIVRSMNDKERRQYCKLTLNVLWNLADHKAGTASAFSDKRKDAERRIDTILKGKKPTRKLWGSLLAVALTLALVLVGSLVASAADETPVTFADVDEEPHATSTVTLTMGQNDPNSPVFFAPVEEGPAVTSTVTLTKGQNDPDSPISFAQGEEEPQATSTVTLAMGQDDSNSPVSFAMAEEGVKESVGGPKASGSLNPGDSIKFDKQTIGAGSVVELHVSWTPTVANLNVGIYVYATNTVYCVNFSGGSGLSEVHISSTGDYAIYVGNLSQSVVHFSLYYLIN